MLHGERPLTPADAPRTAARPGGHAVRHRGTRGRGMRRRGGVRSDACWPSVDRRTARRRIRTASALHPCHHPVAPPLAAAAARQAVSAWGDRQPGAVGHRCGTSGRALPGFAQHASGLAGPAARGATSATTCTPTGRGWRPTRSWRRGPDRRTSTSFETGAWILPDKRPLPADLAAFLDAGAPAGVREHGQRACTSGRRAARPSMRSARMGTASSLAAAGPTWRWSTTVTTASPSARSATRHCSSGWPPPCTTAVRGRRRRRPAAGVPQVVVPQIADQPYWARRVADLGIGAAHEGSTPTVESLYGRAST